MTALDASAEAFLARTGEAGLPSFSQLTPASARERFNRSFAADQRPFASITEVFECFANGLRLKVWRDTADQAAPALLYLHGGGWLLGSPESHEGICRQIAKMSGAVVVAPDYGLAPENPYPAALNDCACALHYLHDNAAALGIDRARIAVGGDSAGGNLAAALALMARDSDIPPLAAQLLIYPNTAPDQTNPSYNRFGDGFGLSATEMSWFRDHYLPRQSDRKDWRAAPLLVPTLKGTAPAVVILAGHDILFDEGALYAQRLHAESHVTCRTWPGQIHGFLSLDGVIPEATEAITWLCRAWAALPVRPTDASSV